jgi:hypothetical protein
MQTHYIIIPRRGAEIPITKTRVEGQKCLVEPTSLQLGSTIRCIIFMVHGVDPLVEIGGQHPTISSLPKSWNKVSLRPSKGVQLIMFSS